MLPILKLGLCVIAADTPSVYSISTNLLAPATFAGAGNPNFTVSLDIRYRHARTLSFTALYERVVFEGTYLDDGLFGEVKGYTVTSSFYGIRLMHRRYEGSSFFHGVYVQPLLGKRRFAGEEITEETKFLYSIGAGWSCGFRINAGPIFIEPQLGLGLAVLHPDLYSKFRRGQLLNSAGIENLMISAHPCFLYFNIGRNISL